MPSRNSSETSAGWTGEAVPTPASSDARLAATAIHARARNALIPPGRPRPGRCPHQPRSGLPPLGEVAAIVGPGLGGGLSGRLARRLGRVLLREAVELRQEVLALRLAPGRQALAL